MPTTRDIDIVFEGRVVWPTAVVVSPWTETGCHEVRAEAASEPHRQGQIVCRC